LGGAVEVNISGEPGLTAAILRPGAPKVQVEASGGGITSVAPPNNNQVQIQLTITNNAPLTEREVRVITREGVSNPLTLKVGHLAEVSSRDDNRTPEGAQILELPAVISGVIGSPSESDYYKFKAKRGERVVLDVQAYRTGSQLDSSLAVLDSSGKELARNEDREGLDSVIEFKVPADGEYRVQLRDFRYFGGGDYRYRLAMGVMPYVTTHFPLGGQRGQTVEVELKGANLENANKMLLHLAANAPIGQREIRASSPRGLSNPVSFEVSDLPQYLEREPNSALDQADLVNVPASLNGRIQAERDYDAYKFHAEKDQQLTFEVQAGRYGSPLDALLTITDARGNVLSRNDDTSGADARLDQKFPESGEYVVIIEDLLERGGENYTYRLNVSSSKPDYSVAFLPDTVRVRRGGRAPVRVELNRMNGFEEPVRIQFENLPPGLFAESLVMSPSSGGSSWMMLNASPGAELGSFQLRLSASATIQGRAVTRAAEPVAGDKTVKAGFVTVLEEVPFSVAPGTLMASIEQNQEAKVEVMVERKNGFAGEVTITAEGFSPRRDPITKSFEIPAAVLKGKESRGTLSLKAKLDAEIGVRPIYLKAESEVDGQKVTDYSQLLPVGTSEIPFVLTATMKKIIVAALPPGSQSAAGEAFFTVKAARRGGFNGEIMLKLDGVPEGVTATVDKIAENGGEANIKLVATEKAPTGKDFQLTVTGTGNFRDKNYKFQPGAITLTVNAPEQTDPKLAGAK
jgi:hypothetical protein